MASFPILFKHLRAVKPGALPGAVLMTTRPSRTVERVFVYRMPLTSTESSCICGSGLPARDLQVELILARPSEQRAVVARGCWKVVTVHCGHGAWSCCCQCRCLRRPHALLSPGISPPSAKHPASRRLPTHWYGPKRPRPAKPGSA